MRPLAKVLLTVLIGLVLVLALSSPSQTTDITAADCKVCHTYAGSASTLHHIVIPNWTLYCANCHPPYTTEPPGDCLYTGCHVGPVAP